MKIKNSVFLIIFIGCCFFLLCGCRNLTTNISSTDEILNNLSKGRENILQDEIVTQYYKTGEKRAQGAMKNGKFVGKWVIWDTDGAKHCEVNYDNEGNRHGEQSFFDKDGKIIKVIYWKHGKMIKSKEFIYGTEINYE